MRPTLLAALTALALPAAASGQTETEPPPPPPAQAPSPTDIVNAAPQSEWAVIAPEDILVMTLAADADGEERTVIIQLMPAPFSQGWVSNIKTLARAKWYDGVSVNRVQDNYVVQWGDPGHDNPESGDVETKPLPKGLKVMGEDDYVQLDLEDRLDYIQQMVFSMIPAILAGGIDARDKTAHPNETIDEVFQAYAGDRYAKLNIFLRGWPIAGDRVRRDNRDRSGFWPIHCYGMVGVGRNYSPDTGSGAELYTVIGHAPRHLDRNIALVGRIISGMEHLSSMPRGSGALGFYTEEEADLRTPILSIRVAADLPEDEQPLFEYLSTESESFARYAEARANRRDPFFIVPAGGADICNIPVPIRRFEYADED